MYTYTNQKQVRLAFWEAFPNLSRRTIKDYSGKGKMHPTDTRCAFVDFLDQLARNGDISQSLADRATL